VILGRRIERTRKGEFRLRLSPAERQLLRSLPADLRALLAADQRDPALRRLFPPAYEDDGQEESEYQRLMADELLEDRREALRVLEATAERDRLRADELEAWLRALNTLRLVLGTRLGITEDFDGTVDEDDPLAHELAVYAYLTWLQEQVVEAAATGFS
jgi:Domain of unknown function (DUF2017)